MNRPEPRRPASRTLGPPLVLLALGIAARLLYVGVGGRAGEVAFVAGGALLVLGPAAVHGAMRRRGVGPGGAAMGAFALPAAWLAKELWRTGAVFPPAETLFYVLNPVSLGILAAGALGVAAAELVWRRVRGGRWALASGPGLVLLVGAALAGAGALLFRGDDAHDLFYGYIALYRWLFAS